MNKIMGPETIEIRQTVNLRVFSEVRQQTYYSVVSLSVMMLVARR